MNTVGVQKKKFFFFYSISFILKGRQGKVQESRRQEREVGGTVSSSNLIQEGPAASVQVRLAPVVQEPGTLRCEEKAKTV